MELTCLVEIPRGSRNKYEYDPASGTIWLDRRLFSSVVFPADYGFLEGTLTDEGEHLDVLMLVNEPTFPGCRVRVRPIGLFRMRDEKGIDDKVLCVPVHDPDWDEVTELDHVSQLTREEIAHFFSVYKDLEPGRVTVIEGWADRAEAEAEVQRALARSGAEPAAASDS